MELLARTCNLETMNAQRILARGFVLAGALFWGVVAWVAEWANDGAPFSETLPFAAVYAVGILLVFVIGLFLENLAAAILALLSASVVAAGIVIGWEVGVWATVLFFFVLPLLMAAALYLLAARMQKICAAAP